MPFLEDYHVDTSSNVDDDDQSDSIFAKPRSRGKGKEWNVLHACTTIEDYQSKFPSLEDYISRNKARTLSNGLIAIINANLKTATISFDALREGYSSILGRAYAESSIW